MQHVSVFVKLHIVIFTFHKALCTTDGTREFLMQILWVGILRETELVEAGVGGGEFRREG